MKNKTRKKRKRKNKKIKKVNLVKKDTVLETFKKHDVVIITILVCLFVMSKRLNKNIFNLLFSFMFASFIGYVIHILSHLVNYRKVYDKSDNLFKCNKYTDKISKALCNFMDFHSVVHHDTKVNKKPINILYESINNAFFQGIGLILATKLASQLDFFMVMFWAVFYVTVHNINFNLKSSWIHRDHHKNTLTNIGFGFEFFDIIFGTGRQTESRPDMAINVIVITVLLYYLVPYFKKQ